jgi:NTP pyrophosphatase (non-canonical NTP hydrolase)
MTTNTEFELSTENLQLLNQLRDFVAENAIRKGFRTVLRGDLTDDQWEGKTGALLRAAVMSANLHGETSEFWEAFRAGTLNEPCDKAPKMEAMGLPALTCAEEEIADVIIRALDQAQAHGVDVAKAVAVKAAYNSGRAYLHGGKQA